MMDPSWDSKRWFKNVTTVGTPVYDSKDSNHRSLKSKINYFFLHIGPEIFLPECSD